ncbi:multiple resistance and pH regulation protein F [Thiocystis minor]|uniref:monovalent cation/H+ antiporter complex subunit F n=1 Tax=Thiocystis minor TaxID=61597 RepID=UPI001911BC5F|nr:monovalent cation/H+ antiporter complex subunit F [Thiocystis minor]MBK5965358.1 multiple resistance and pH regulation protein F [Thiocystis minor]
MTEVFMAAALVLLLAMAAGLVRVIVGPSAADRMMGAQLLGTMGIGVLLLLAFAFERDALTDVALIFGLLASVAAVALTRRRIGQDQD